MDPKWRTFLVLLVLLVGASVLIVVAGGDSDGESSGSITVQQAPTSQGGAEVLVTVPDDLNVPATNGGNTLVDLVCTDDAGGTVLRSKQPWPFLKDGDPPAAHAHQPASPDELKSIARCELVGTEPELSGELGLAR